MPSTRTYDVAVAYRIYPQVAAPARPLPGSDNKLLLSEICLRSFRRSLGGIRAKIFVILDSCPQSYAELFRKYFEDQDLEFIPLDSAGNQATFVKQIDVLLQQEYSDFVYFAEDDYFYRPEQFSKLLEFIATNPEADFVSPYDHLDCYTTSIHRQPKWITCSGDRHWRTAASTCLTFLTRKQTLAATSSAFRTYGRRNHDFSIWLSITKSQVFNPLAFMKYALRNHVYAKVLVKAWLHCWRQILFGDRYRLWVPLPAAATHLNAERLSPAVDWSAMMQAQLEEMRVAR